MTGSEAIAYIHSMVWDRSATGYEHARELLEKMGNPQKDLRYVHIGGTNGKGSTAAMIASILKNAGYRTGLYTSPFIFRFNERMQVDGMQITDDELGSVTEEVKAVVDRYDLHPSEFALLSCVAFAYFKYKKCDIVVLEVGMGGENDSTNVIDCADVSVLTNIGMDHTEFLGHTIEEIASTKAGILKEGTRAVLYPNTPSVEAVLSEVCKCKQIPYVIPDFSKIDRISHNLMGQNFNFSSYQDLHLPLLGNHQLCNAAVAISTIELLNETGWNISEEALRQGLREVTWPGRFEVLSQKPLFIVDGGHNPQCIQALAKNVSTYLDDKRIIALVGVLADKDYEEMFEPILSQIDEFITITPPSPRSLSASELAGYLQAKGKVATSSTDIKEAVRIAISKADDESAVLCFGSLYTIGELQEAILFYFSE